MHKRATNTVEQPENPEAVELQNIFLQASSVRSAVAYLRGVAHDNTHRRGWSVNNLLRKYYRFKKANKETMFLQRIATAGAVAREG